MNFLTFLSHFGNVCSIVGLGLSFWLMYRTGKIKEKIDEAVEENNKIANYINMRDEILSGLNECAAYLNAEHPRDEQLPYLTKLDGHLATLAACYPNMTAKMKNDIDFVRNSCNNRYFSFINVVRPLDDIISKLRMEAFRYG